MSAIDDLLTGSIDNNNTNNNNGDNLMGNSDNNNQLLDFLNSTDINQNPNINDVQDLENIHFKPHTQSNNNTYSNTDNLNGIFDNNNVNNDVTNDANIPTRFNEIINELDCSLFSLQSTFEIHTLLNNLTTTVESKDHDKKTNELNESIKKQIKLNEKLQSEWAKESVQLSAQVSQLTNQTNEINTINNENKAELSRVNNEILINKRAESQWLTRMQARTAHVDITLLNRNSIKYIVKYLTLSDIVNSLFVCRRWNYNLNNGEYWRIITLQIVSRVLQQQKLLKQNDLNNSLLSSYSNNNIITVTLAGQNKPTSLANKAQTLSKNDIFTYCLKHIQRQIDPAQSQFDDLNLKNKAHINTVTLLNTELSELKHKLGLARVSHGDWIEQAKQLQLDKINIANQMKLCEQQIKQQQLQRDQIKSESVAQAKKLESALNLLHDVSSFISNTKNSVIDNEKAVKQQKEEQIQQLQAKKKVLVKAVKDLRKQIEGSKQEKLDYEVKIKELKDKLKAI